MISGRSKLAFASLSVCVQAWYAWYLSQVGAGKGLHGLAPLVIKDYRAAGHPMI